MDELMKIIERYTEGNYLIGNTAKEEMAKDIFALFNVVWRGEQFKCDCGCTDHYKNEMHDSVKCADCGTVYARI